MVADPKQLSLGSNASEDTEAVPESWVVDRFSTIPFASFPWVFPMALRQPHLTNAERDTWLRMDIRHELDRQVQVQGRDPSHVVTMPSPKFLLEDTLGGTRTPWNALGLDLKDAKRIVNGYRKRAQQKGVHIASHPSWGRLHPQRHNAVEELGVAFLALEDAGTATTFEAAHIAAVQAAEAAKAALDAASKVEQYSGGHPNALHDVLEAQANAHAATLAADEAATIAARFEQSATGNRQGIDSTARAKPNNLGPESTGNRQGSERPLTNLAANLRNEVPSDVTDSPDSLTKITRTEGSLVSDRTGPNKASGDRNGKTPGFGECSDRTVPQADNAWAPNATQAPQVSDLAAAFGWAARRCWIQVADNQASLLQKAISKYGRDLACSILHQWVASRTTVASHRNPKFRAYTIGHVFNISDRASAGYDVANQVIAEARATPLPKADLDALCATTAASDARLLAVHQLLQTGELQWLEKDEALARIETLASVFKARFETVAEPHAFPDPEQVQKYAKTLFWALREETATERQRRHQRDVDRLVDQLLSQCSTEAPWAFEAALARLPTDVRLAYEADLRAGYHAARLQAGNANAGGTAETHADDVQKAPKEAARIVDTDSEPTEPVNPAADLHQPDQPEAEEERARLLTEIQRIADCLTQWRKPVELKDEELTDIVDVNRRGLDDDLHRRAVEYMLARRYGQQLAELAKTLANGEGAEEQARTTLAAAKARFDLNPADTTTNLQPGGVRW